MQERQFRVWTNYFFLLIGGIVCAISGIGLLAHIIDAIDGTNVDVFGIILSLVVFYIVFRLIKQERYRKIVGLHPPFSVRQVNRLLSKEVFHEVEGLNHVWESENWLRVDGKFVPKNFIIGIYEGSRTSTYSNYTRMHLVIINGKSITYDAENKYSRYAEQLRIFKQILPNAVISYPDGEFKKWSSDNEDKIKERMDQYFLNHEAEDLVYNWTNINGCDSTKDIEATDDDIDGEVDYQDGLFSFLHRENDEKIEPRKELIQDQEFINRFREELKKFGDMTLAINETEQEQFENSYLFILNRRLPKGFEGTYNEYIHSNSNNIWIILHYDDSLSILYPFSCM
jgi:hypothetical protein